MNIRPYNKKDFRYIQDLCVATSSYAEDDTPTNRALLCAMYCDYYLDNQPEFCFVAVDDDDMPVGYILCSADCDDYSDCMNELYLPLVRKIDSNEFFKFNAYSKVTQRYIRQGYTAHLYMDILEEYRSDELATNLVESLCAKLMESNVEGLYVSCAKKDVEVCAFYEKLGFTDIDYISGAVVYGKKFFED